MKPTNKLDSMIPSCFVTEINKQEGFIIAMKGKDVFKFNLSADISQIVEIGNTIYINNENIKEGSTPIYTLVIKENKIVKDKLSENLKTYLLSTVPKRKIRVGKHIPIPSDEKSLDTYADHLVRVTSIKDKKNKDTMI